MSVDISRALTIAGWTNESELTWLAEQAQSHHDIAEIGSWRGRSTRALADNTPGWVLAVDTWKGTEADGHFKELEGRPEGWLFDEFMRNVEGTHGGFMKMPSVEAAAVCVSHGGDFDMVFIDAAHDYKNVKADILAWRPLLRPGGLLCGHDYDCGRPGVVRAVNELIPNKKRGPGSIWIA